MSSDFVFAGGDLGRSGSRAVDSPPLER